MDFWGITHSGKIRQQNQDVFKIFLDEDNKNITVLVVCDGMGGARAGHVASTLAADTFVDHIEKHIEDVRKQKNVATNMTEAVAASNKAVYDKSNENTEFAGMGTTLTAAISTPDGEVVVNVGDSRLYHITSQSIAQITKDHSVVEDMISRGDLTRTEAKRHPNRNLITKALGTNKKEAPDVFFLNLAEGEYLLLCSDGLSNVILDSEILFELQKSRSVKTSCETLVDMALSRGAPDNVTVVIFRKQQRDSTSEMQVPAV
ncbi:MAG: Stp1/IreP family PP2C-type Ser/Thr phosphatase [Oscillospiraceae bacterium]|nr:Stp1/IreP family PP2C-type Ser/Thr phosphatase [Oscillospiraceae bacterium]